MLNQEKIHSLGPVGNISRSGFSCKNKVWTICLIYSIWPWLISLLNSFHPHEEDLSSTNGKGSLNLVLLTLFSITNSGLSESESRSVCPTVCDPVDYAVHGILQARVLEWVAFPLLQGIFPTQRLNLGLPHCRRILYQLNHKGSPSYKEEAS